VAAWSLIGKPFLACYRAAGNFVFARFGSGAAIEFKPLTPVEAHADTLVEIVNTRVPPTSEWANVRITTPLKLNVHDFAYLPAVVVVSLILATPLPWRRRMFALAVAGYLIAAYLVVWAWLSVLDTISRPTPPLPTHGFMLGPIARTLVTFLSENVLDSVNACGYIIPIFIWIISAFRRKDRGWLLARFLPSVPQSEASGKAA
jgi:hypothetical protein